MKVICTFRSGDAIPDDVIALGNTPDSTFPISFGHNYIVFAICIWKGIVNYLIVNDENNRPDWIPAVFFHVTDGRLPSAWRYSFWEKTAGFEVSAVFGYEELATDDPAHYIALLEREPEAMRVFETRSSEIEAES